MSFNEYKYLWPPRPEKAIPATFLPHYEKRGWVAQYKKNGTCSLVYVKPDKSIIVKTRHNTDHAAWTPSEEFEKQFQFLQGQGWYVFVGEVLHSKTPHIKDTIYVFDILVSDGLYLVGSTFQARIDLLNSILPHNALDITKSHYVVLPKLWLARTIKSNFVEVFNNINEVENEGLVLKDPEATLNLCLREDSNNAWQLKCRRATKNYSF